MPENAVSRRHFYVYLCLWWDFPAAAHSGDRRSLLNPFGIILSAPFRVWLRVWGVRIMPGKTTQ